MLLKDQIALVEMEATAPIELSVPIRQQIRREIRELSKSQRRITKPVVTRKDVKSRFSPGVTMRPRAISILVVGEPELEAALELTALATSKNMGVQITTEQNGVLKYYIVEGPKAVSSVQTIVKKELDENRVAEVELYRGKAQYMSSNITIVKPGVPAVENKSRITVKDEESFEKALELFAGGPVRLSTLNKTYTINDFDKAATIASDQLAAGRVVIVERAELVKAKPKTELLPSHHPDTTGIVRVTNEASFYKALDLVTQGPVQIYDSSHNYPHITDFDQAAELLAQMWTDKNHPVVIKEK